MEVFCHSNNDMKGKLYKTNLRRLVSIILAITVLVTSVGLGTFLVEAEETDTYTTLYLIDNTLEKWVGDDNAVIELVDNTSGHEHYMMTKVNDTTWSVKVPQSAYNITFNRYSPDKSIQWNSWSAGGRDFNNAYFADGSEYGHWEAIEEIDETEEKYFHAGDIVYLDVSEFTSWKNDNAIMYVNFSEASKEVNNGNNISISDADKVYYNPKKVEIEVAENVYAYVITFEDEGATELRFWRGNDFTLWNCSVVLTYEDFDSGTNCVKISNWNSTGELTIS
ncbi:MAG: hypothetical protein IJF37_00510 [Lachnospiraceae bacterium]|nr:hypothetical protein [Lachnospiraceae bacterium]